MQLVVQSGTGMEPGKTYPVVSGRTMSVGRHSTNDIVIPDEQVSRKHAELELRDGTLYVTDNNSSNGTFVNGTRIGGSQPLREGDLVQIGMNSFKLTGVLSETQLPTTPLGSAYAPTINLSSSEAQAAQSSGSYPDYNQSPAAMPTTGPLGYDQNAAYGQPQQYNQPGIYDQPAAYGQPQQYNQAQPYNQPATSYDQQPSGQQYGQPQQYGQAPAQPQQYGQAPAQQYGQPAAQPQQYAQNAGYNYNDPNQAQQAQAGYPPGAYAPQGMPPQGYAPAPGIAPAKKSGLPAWLFAVLAVVVLAVIAAVVLLTGVLGASGVGDVPAPPGSTKLDVNRGDLEKVFNAAGSNTFKDVNLGFYTSPKSSKETLDFYEKEMTGKGWKVVQRREGLGSQILTLSKDSQAIAVQVQPNLRKEQIDVQTALIPALKDKIKVGESLVLVIQGSSANVLGAA